MISEIRVVKERDRFHSDIERFFNQFTQWKRPSVFFEKAWKPYCDIYESDKYLHVIVEISGVAEDEVEAILDGRHLIIRGNRPQVHPKETRYTHQVEINFGKFERIIELPYEVDSEETSATYNNGFLYVKLRKAEPGVIRGIHII